MDKQNKMKTKTPLSIKLLKMNLAHHIKEKRRFIKIYKGVIKNKVDDETRLYFYGKIQSSDKYLDDLNAAIKKLSPK